MSIEQVLKKLKAPRKVILGTKYLVGGIKTFSSSDSPLRFALLRMFSRVVFPRYRFKWPQMAWWDNQSFTAYLDRFDETRGMNADRRWMLYQLMRLVDGVPGDTAECGVYKGADSYLMCLVNRKNTTHKRVHYIFDSFEGLSDPSNSDGTFWTKGDLLCEMDIVKQNLAEFENISFHKGWIPERFSDVDSRKFAFVHIDVDLYQPTFDSIAFFYPRMNAGGIIICDDYGFTSCPGATKAMDEFLADKTEKMISLPCGGGFFVKACKTEEAIY